MKAARSLRRESVLRSKATKTALLGMAVIAAALLGNVARADEATLGSILDKGAQKLSAATLKAELTSGRLRTPEGFSYQADGSLTGQSSGLDVVGDWEIDADGRQCVSWYLEQFRDAQSGNFCRYWFRIGGSTYFLESRSDTDRKQLVRRVSP